MEGKGQNDRHRKPRGFLDDDQLLLTVRHAGALAPEQIAEVEKAVANILNRGRDQFAGAGFRLGDLKLAEVPVEFERRPISFPLNPNQRTLTVLAGKVQVVNREAKEYGAAVPVINILNREFATREVFVEDVELVTATADWLIGITGDVIIKGGPGTGPRPAPNATREAAEFRGPEQVYTQWPGTPKSGAGVSVVILDTVPETDVHGMQEDDVRYNDLLKTLLPRLRIHRDIGPHAPSEGHELEDYDYPMPDHGLFVAGIVHLVAREAEIHLVRVLNDRGVGDLRALLAGLQLALELSKKGPVVVNCSLTLAIPPKQETDHTRLRRDRQHGFVTPLEDLCQQLAEGIGVKYPIVLVGAAGNDSRQFVPPGGHRVPGYPAALDSVVGVAALQHDGRPPVYSNQADWDLKAGNLRRSGLAVFGGDDGPDGTGVLGVFSAAAFPNQEPNTNGWAYWSGTSFAAPIISGIVAQGLSGGLDAETVLKGIFAAAEPDVAAKPDTDVGEALDVVQGSSNGSAE